VHIIEQLEKIVRNSPEAVALRGHQGELSYRQFHDRVCGLCGLLQNHGIAEGQRVLIHLDRSFETIIAIYAVLASGAAYVPVEIENPANRLEKIIRDASPAVILSGPDGEFLSQTANIARLDPSTWPDSGPEPVERNPKLAYIIYTSGSTGTPKGVAVGYRSLENYLAWALESLPYNGGGVPLLASVAFDHSVSCYFPPLLKGETLTVLPPLQGGKALAMGLLAGQRYSYIKITPSHARLLTIEQRAQMGRAADLIMFGGERVAPELVRDVRRDNPELTVMNHYGPTETTVGCCVFQLSPREAIPPIIPIGRPIPGVETVIQKLNGERAQCGEPGELLVGGIALAEQYWGLLEATTHAFRAESFDGLAAGRWYHTGDSVREMSDGNIEYLGRLDDQVKVLGHRIEPREVEQAIRDTEMVTDVVMLTSDRSDGVEIVAAITPKLSTSMLDGLRTRLRATLPSVMVPSKIVSFDTLPVRASGKLNQEFVLQEARRTESAASEQTVETQLLAQFRDALGLEQLRAADDFFECGGDSMAAVEITAWASARFQISLDPAALFEHPSAMELARRIGELSLKT